MVDGKKRETIPGPAVEETFWQLPDIAAYWPATESFNTLNIDAPNGVSFLRGLHVCALTQIRARNLGPPFPSNGCEAKEWTWRSHS